MSLRVQVSCKLVLPRLLVRVSLRVRMAPTNRPVAKAALKVVKAEPVDDGGSGGVADVVEHEATIERKMRRYARQVEYLEKEIDKTDNVDTTDTGAASSSGVETMVVAPPPKALHAGMLVNTPPPPIIPGPMPPPLPPQHTIAPKAVIPLSSGLKLRLNIHTGSSGLMPPPLPPQHSHAPKAVVVVPPYELMPPPLPLRKQKAHPPTIPPPVDLMRPKANPETSTPRRTVTSSVRTAPNLAPWKRQRGS